MIGASIGITSEHLELPVSDAYVRLIDIGLIAYLIHEVNLPSLVIGTQARRIWSIPFVITGAFTYGFFVWEGAGAFVQYSGIPMVLLFLTTMLVIYRTRSARLLTGELKTQYDSSLAFCSKQNPDFEYQSVKLSRWDLRARDWLLLLVILRIASPLFIGTFAFAAIMGAIDDRIAFSATVEIILIVMLVLAKMNNHYKLLRTPIRFLASLKNIKDATETRTATSFIRGFASPAGLLYVFFIGTTILFATSSSFVFGNQTYLLWTDNKSHLNFFEIMVVSILFTIAPLSFVMPLLFSTFLIMQRGRRFRVPKFSWMLIPFSILIVATLHGHIPSLAWLVNFDADELVIQSVFFGGMSIASMAYWITSYRIGNTVTLQKKEKKIIVIALVIFAITYLSNGENILQTLTSIALPSFLWFYAFRFLVIPKPEDSEPRKLSALFSVAILILAILNFLEGKSTSSILLTVLFVVSIFRQLNARQIESLGKKVFRMQEHTYKSALRYWQY